MSSERFTIELKQSHLEEIMKLTGDSKSEIIRKALELMSAADQVIKSGRSMYVGMDGLLLSKEDLSHKEFVKIENFKSNEEMLSTETIESMRADIEVLKNEINSIKISNEIKSDIMSDVNQIDNELNRPSPRKKFIKIFLESLRDNLAKAAGAGTVAAIGLVTAMIAKYFGVF